MSDDTIEVKYQNICSRCGTKDNWIGSGLIRACRGCGTWYYFKRGSMEGWARWFTFPDDPEKEKVWNDMSRMWFSKRWET